MFHSTQCSIAAHKPLLLAIVRHSLEHSSMRHKPYVSLKGSRVPAGGSLIQRLLKGDDKARHTWKAAF